MERLTKQENLAGAPVRVPLPAPVPCVLACGAETRTTFCLARGAEAVLHGPFRDLTDYACFEDYKRRIREALGGGAPDRVAHDLHPDYVSTRYARTLGVRATVAVQHHHAHVVSCLAENGVATPALGVAFDGTGYGPDGTVWGGEFLLAEPARYRRLAHLQPYVLPGGEQAIRDPFRMAFALLLADLPDEADRVAAERLPAIPETERRILRRMVERRFQSPTASSAGRLFDAVSALAGLCPPSPRPAEAAIRLEEAADPSVSDAYPFEIRGEGDRLVLSPGPAIRRIVADLEAGVPAGAVSARFHNGLAEGAAEICARLRDQTRLTAAALSGGVFQNRLLLQGTQTRLRARGFEVYAHRSVPASDAGLSLGQAWVAAARARP